MAAKTVSEVRRVLPAAPPSGAALSVVIGMACGYLALMLAAFFVFRSPLVMVSGNQMNYDRAVFTAVNAATLTGFQQTVGVREFNASGSAGVLAVFVLALAGMLFSMIGGGLAVVRIARLPYTDRQVVTAGCTSVALMTLAGAVCLANGGRGVFDALFLSASAFGNSGLYIGKLPSLFSPATFLVLLPLALLGGLGLPVLMELFDLTFGRLNVSRHSRVVLRTSAIVYLAALLVLLVVQFPIAGNWPAWRQALASSSAVAINARTAGLPLNSLSALSASAQWVVMVLMVIGAAPAGTAGGIKVTTIWHLARAIISSLRGETIGRALGVAGTWIAIYLAVWFVGFLALLSIVPEIPPDRLLFLSVSAIGNVGLSHDPVALTGAPLLILSGLMLAGRIAPVAILWWMVTAAPDADVALG